MKKTMRCWSAAAFLLCTVFAHQGLASESGSFVLVRDRAPAATFVLTAEQAGLVASNGVAAGMLDDFNADLRECTGCELPVSESDAGTDPVIRFAIETRTPEDEDRFAVTFPDERTMLITGSTMSLRWALNHVLTEFAGVRYLAHSQNGAHFPKITDLKAPRSSISVAPSFNLSRETTAAAPGYWEKRMGMFARIPRGHELWKHAFPAKKYIQRNEYPDFIFPVIDGKRWLPHEDPSRMKAWRKYSGRWSDYGAHWQPCLTDDRVVDEAVKNIIAYFDENPGKYGISMTINDNGGFCQCDSCRALMSGERNMTGHSDYSDLYYGWLNKVVARVAEKHPDKYFGVVTYRETAAPPKFRLHERIVPFLLFDVPQWRDSLVMAKQLEFFGQWGEKASALGARAYPWGWSYDIPQVCFGLQQATMQQAHAVGARAFCVLSLLGGIEEGPKQYLYHKLMWNVNLNLDAVLTDWYEACVGKEAAPCLAEYFQVWERIWNEEAVKTSWFQDGKNKTYLNFAANKSYLYAVGAGDLPKLRGLMERVVELADQHGDARQKIRAGWLMRNFEYSEACVHAMGGHIFPPSGIAETADQAVAYLSFLPEAVRYDALRLHLHEQRASDPDFKGYGAILPSYVNLALASIAATASHPDVSEALRSASQNSGLPPETRGLLDVFAKMAQGEPVENLMLDGSFEKDNLDWRSEEGQQKTQLSRERACHGESSLKLNLAPPHRSLISRHGRDLPHQRVKSGIYYVGLMVYVETEHPDAESHVQFRATARCLDGAPQMSHFDSPRIHVPPGKWTRISLVADTRSNTKGDRDSINLDRIHFRNYSKGDIAYVDDIVVVSLTQ